MSDKILWNALRKGEKSALATIYNVHFDDLYRYGKRFTQDDGLVGDSIQELFIELWDRRTKLSETDAIKPYLLTSLRRKIIYQLNKNSKISREEIGDVHFDSELSIDQVIEKDETDIENKSKLQEAFAQLSDRQKEIIYLKYYSEMSYEEISKIMDLNYQSARNLLSRAMAKLSKSLTLFIAFAIMCLYDFIFLQ